MMLISLSFKKIKAVLSSEKDPTKSGSFFREVKKLKIIESGQEGHLNLPLTLRQWF